MSSEIDKNINESTQEVKPVEEIIEVQETPQSASQGISLSGIYQAFKDVHEASRATSQAEKDLKALQATLKADTETLEHRRHIDANFDQIIFEQTTIVEQGVVSQGKIVEITKENKEKKSKLQEELEALEAQNKRSLAPLIERNDEAQAKLDEAARHLAHCKRTEQNSRQNLENLISQRNKQSKSLNASITTSEEAIRKLKNETLDRSAELTNRDKLDLREKITIEQNRLAEFKQNLHRIELSAQKNIEEAQQTIEVEAARLEKTRVHHDEIKKDAELKLKRLEEQSEQCRLAEEAIQKQIDDIDAYQKTLDDHNGEIQKAIEEAKDLINEAHDIHENPEKTQQLALTILKNEALLEQQEITHAELQAYEDELRRTTRTSRISTLAGILVIVLIIVLVIVGISMGWFS